MPRRSTSSNGIQEELVDRFGPTPDQALALLACHRLRLAGKRLGVSKIDAGAERTTIQFVKHPPFDAGALIVLVQKDGRIRFAGPGSPAHRARRAQSR